MVNKKDAWRPPLEHSVKPGDLLWGAPGWEESNPEIPNHYIVHWQFTDDSEEYIGVDYWDGEHWGRRWCDYHRFEWCIL